jgi:hypothetical protein
MGFTGSSCRGVKEDPDKVVDEAIRPSGDRGRDRDSHGSGEGEGDVGWAVVEWLGCNRLIRAVESLGVPFRAKGDLVREVRDHFAEGAPRRWVWGPAEGEAEGDVCNGGKYHDRLDGCFC